MLKKRDIRCHTKNLPGIVLRYVEKGYKVRRIAKDGDYSIVQFVDKNDDGEVE